MPLATSPAKSGLSTGVKAGIAIAVIASVLLAIIILLFLRRRLGSQTGQVQEDHFPSQPELPTQANAHDILGENTGHELAEKSEWNQGVAELSDVKKVSDLYPRKAELPSDGPEYTIEGKDLPANVPEHKIEREELPVTVMTERHELGTDHIQ